MLPANYVRVGSQPMFTEKKPAFGLQHAPRLSERSGERIDRAESESRDHAIEADVFERERLGDSGKN